MSLSYRSYFGAKVIDGVIMNSLPYDMFEASVCYETRMGSHAYGVATEESDLDYYAVCIPPLNYLFPAMSGQIMGYNTNNRFEQLQIQDGIDYNAYSIQKYFYLCRDGNPNMIDSLFTLPKDVLYADPVGQLIKDNRHLFLSQLCWHRFKGMAWSHMSRVKSGHIKESRIPLAEKYGYDTKDAYHIVRLALEVSDIISIGDINLGSENNIAILKGIRNGRYKKEEVFQMFDSITTRIEVDIKNGRSAVSHSPDDVAIYNLLVNCLIRAYGIKNLKKAGFEWR